MAGLTPTGLTIKTLPEIIANINSKLASEGFSTATNSPEQVIVGVFSDELSDGWEAFQSLYDAFNPKTSSNTSLDNIADIVNVQRLPATKSLIVEEVTGTVGASIPIGTVFTAASDSTIRFLSTSSFSLSNTQFSDIQIQVTSVVDSTEYTLTINNTVCTIVSGAFTTAADILSALKTSVDANIPGVTTSLPSSTVLRINVTEVDSVYPITIGSRLGSVSVSDILTLEAENFGSVPVPANTITALFVPIPGVTSVTNNKAAVEGRLEETDEELRVRRYQSVSINGASTDPAILSRVRAVDGVVAAFLIQNKTMVVDSDGRPAKSFEVVVEGGDDDVIAQTIWDYHPVGIESYGSITKTLEDGNIVKFSRPTTVYFRVVVEYTRDLEEEFPGSGEQGIIDSVVEYGNSLQVGEDVIPKRFFGNIFDNVPGIEDLTVTVSKSYDLVTWEAYTGSKVSIAKTENALFDETRVYPSEIE